MQSGLVGKPAFVHYFAMLVIPRWSANFPRAHLALDAERQEWTASTARKADATCQKSSGPVWSEAIVALHVCMRCQVTAAVDLPRFDHEQVRDQSPFRHVATAEDQA